MISQELKKYNLPDQPGVYFFKQGRDILYIGKATSLKDRVKSYFAGDLGETRGPKLERMLELANKIEWQETDSVLEALLLETELIKKHQPKYNSREKDDKSYWYVIITDEDFPRVLAIRGKELENSKSLKNPYLSKSNFVNYTKVGIKYQFGPFPYGAEMKEALKIIHKIFPFRDKCLPCVASAEQDVPHEAKPRGKCQPCFNRQIGLCPGVCTGEISKTDYQKIVRNIKLFFAGKKKEVVKNLEQEMKVLSKKQEFEKAGKIRDQIFALNHIRDVSLLKNKSEIVRSRFSSEPEMRLRMISPRSLRIEAYDIAHLSGKNTVGGMVVWQDGEMLKSEYKKFKLKGAKAGQPDDPANLREVLERRLNHPDWPMPDIIVVDGNQVQRGVVESVFLTPSPAIIAVTKNTKHKAEKLIGDPAIIHDYHHAIIEANAEAHRFALSYHRQMMRRIG